MKALRNTLAVVLTVIMILSLTYSALLFTVRRCVSTVHIPTILLSMDYSTLPLPDGEGGTISVYDKLSSILHVLAITIDKDRVTDCVRLLSINKILSDIADETIDWFFFDGAYPTKITPRYMAEFSLTYAGDDVNNLISLFGDPVEVLSTVIEAQLEPLDIDGHLAEAEKYKPFFSSGAMYLSLSLAAGAALLALVCLKMKAGKWLYFIGVGVVLSGGLCYAAYILMVNNEYYRTIAQLQQLFYPTVVTAGIYGVILMIAGLVPAVIAGIISIITHLKSKRHASTSDE